jgi:hypothetical protein
MAEREQITELAYHLVRSGYLDRDDTVSEIIEIVDADDPESIAFAGEAVDAAFQAHAADEHRWELTDNDRISRAALALEANGVVFRENFTCCQTCGFGEIGDEIRGAAELGSNVRGFAFFHWQDTESAVNGHGLCLSYGAVGDHDGDDAYNAASLEVGHEVADALTREGLAVTWSGALTRRISLSVRWRRRRFTAPPLVDAAVS